MANNDQQATDFLDQHHVQWQREGERIVVPGDLDVSGRGLTALPDLSGVEIRGNFDCSENHLTTLKGSPQKLGNHFTCTGNQLTSLEGSPAHVPGIFCCAFNNLTSLEGGPQIVGDNFDCFGNKLTSLNGGPHTVLGDYNCFDNQIISYEGKPKVLKGVIINGNYGSHLSREKSPHR